MTEVQLIGSRSSILYSIIEGLNLGILVTPGSRISILTAAGRLLLPRPDGWYHKIWYVAPGF